MLKEVKPLVLYDVEHGIAMEPMRGKWASSRVDLGYTELFSIPEVTAVFISSCNSGLGDCLVIHQARYCYAPNAGDSGPISHQGGCLMGFLELRQEPVVHSRVTAGLAV